MNTNTSTTTTTATTSAKITKTIFLKASRERVWAFLTEPELLARWFHASSQKLSEGQPYKLLGDNPSTDQQAMCWGTVTEARSPERLVYTFTHNHLAGHETRVQWTLTAVDQGTMLELVHDGFQGGDFDAFDMLAAHDKGWDDHFVKFRERVAVAE